MDFCDCGAMLSSFSPDGVHCVACYEALAGRSETGVSVWREVRFREYCAGLQAVILAGADVRAVVNGRSCGVIEVEACGLGILVNYITATSPVEQRALLAADVTLTVAFVNS